MYTFVSALLRLKGLNERFEQVDLTQVRMADLFSKYRDGYIELNNVSLKDNTFVTLNELKSSQRYVYSNSYFKDWLVSQGNITIYGYNKRPIIQSGTVSYGDAFQSGFSVRRVNQADVFNENTYPTGMMEDVYITKTMPEDGMLSNYVLPVVNGLAHLHIPKERGLLIKGAGTTADVSGDFHLGILTFENVGKLQFVTIKDENLHLNKAAFAKQGVYVDLGVNLKGKSVLLSLAGRLLFDSRIVSVINKEGLVRVNLQNIDLLKLIQQTIPYLELKSLNLDERIYHNGCLTRENVSADDCVIALFKLIQSFFIVIDAPDVSCKTDSMMSPRMPGFFETYQNTYLPYIDDNGFIKPYWKMTHTGEFNSVYRMHLADTCYKDQVIETGIDYPNDTWLPDNYTFTERPLYHTGRLLSIEYEKMIFI